MMIVHWSMEEWSCPPDDSSRENTSLLNEEDCLTQMEDCNSNSGENTTIALDDRWNNDENDAELCIPILFYYDSKSLKKRDEERYRRSMLQFAGLSHALYTLPQTILPLVSPADVSTNEEDENAAAIQMNSPDFLTKVVHFNSASAWVFVPLGVPPRRSEPPREKLVRIVAVVQIATTERPGKRSRAATPTAVALAVQRADRLFSLLRHGSIHDRLLRPPPHHHPHLFDSSPRDREEYYPGMNLLYQWYRKRPRSFHLGDPPFLSTLSYTLLRRDLEYHFNDWIMNCSICRNIIECVPLPSINNPEINTFASNGRLFQSNIDPNVIHILESTLNELCQSILYSSFLGISFFMQNQLISQHFTATTTFESSHVIHVSNGMLLPNETAFLLYQYMTQLQRRMTIPLAEETHRSEKKKGLAMRFPSFARSFLKDDTMRSPPTPTELPIFLPPPPLSLFNVMEDIESNTFVYESGTVWAPRVSLTLTSETTVSARMCLFSHKNLHALIYLSSVMVEELESKEMYQNVLSEIAQALTTAFMDPAGNVSESVNTIGNPERDISVLQRSWDTMEGFDMIAIDRLHNTAKIFLDEMDFSDARNPKDLPSISHISFPLDDRHRLANHLSLDTLLALEDAFEEVLQYQKNRHNCRDSAILPSYFEMCTLLQNYWVYCHVEQDKELYILFHTSHFVTMSDVQQVAQQMRKEFMCSLE